MDQVYANGRTLFGAMHRQDLDMMRLLVKWGADVNLGIPTIGHSPLHRASYYDLPEFAQYLLEKGAHVNAPTKGPNPDFGIPSEVQEVGGETPLHYAGGFAGSELILYLLEHGADPGIRNQTSLLPLDWAVARDRPEKIAMLLSSELSD